MARQSYRLLAGSLAILALFAGVGIMACDDKGRNEEDRRRAEAQANTTARPAEGPAVSKPYVSVPVEPKKQTKQDTEAAPPSWKPGDPVKVRPDLRRSEEAAPSPPNTDEKK